MLEDCAGMYVLIVLCLLATVISGCVIWCFETLLQDPLEEQQPFLRGLFEGFWWCFTIVTSGYGARIVQSLPAKVYSVIWILVGVVMFSLMTSTFTAELMYVMGHHSNTMASANVGVLKYRDYDASLVAREGGVVKEAHDASNFHMDILTLIRMLRMKEIDGMVLDKYTLKYTIGLCHFFALIF